MSPPKFEYIDALRGWAFLGVFFTHASYHTQGLPKPLQSFFAAGHYGVHLFFLLSAFTLFHSLHSRPYAQGWVRAFYLRRFFRIAPLFYCAIVVFSLWRIFVIGRAPSMEETGLAALFLNGFSVPYINSLVPGQWSVGIEFVFYLFVPILVRLIGSLRAATVALVAFAAITALSRPIARHLGVQDLLYLHVWLPSQLFVFGLGIVLYFIVLPPTSSVLERRPSSSGRAFTYAALVLVIGLLIFSERLPATQSVISVGFFVLVYALSRWPVKALVNRSLQAVGKVSFSAYIMHFLVLYVGEVTIFRLAESWGPWANLALLVLVALPISLALSAATYRWIEVPGQSIGKRLIRNFAKV